MYIEVADPDALAGVFEQSAEKPTLLFVYDPYCPTNTRAKNELDKLAEDIYVVNVAEQHALGTAVQLYTRVRHDRHSDHLLESRLYGTPRWNITALASRWVAEGIETGKRETQRSEISEQPRLEISRNLGAVCVSPCPVRVARMK